MSTHTVDLEIYDLEAWANGWIAEYEKCWQALPDKESWFSVIRVPSRRHHAKILQKIDPEKAKHLLLFFEEESPSITFVEEEEKVTNEMLCVRLVQAEAKSMAPIPWPAAMLRSMQQSPDAYDRLQEVRESLELPILYTKSKKGRGGWAHSF